MNNNVPPRTSFGTQRTGINQTSQRPGLGQSARPATTTTPARTGVATPRSGIGARPTTTTSTQGAKPAATASFFGNVAPQKLTVGIADMKMLQWNGELITYALGSCIGICLYDPGIKLGALIHIMLPINMETGRKNTMKYADTGIRETLKLMEAKGARRNRMTAKIAGGAKMFEVNGNSNLGNIGQRNIESVRLNLRKEGIRIIAENVGGTVARTLSFFPADGAGEIRAYGQPVLAL